jgi:hypothetical protein
LPREGEGEYYTKIKYHLNPQTGDWRRGISFMVDLRMAGLRPGPRSFAALIDACRVGGQPAKALDIFQASVA